jgi:hypothetical protein
MPKVKINIKEKDGSVIECNAEGFFFLVLSFSNIKSKLKKIVKEYND